MEIRGLSKLSIIIIAALGLGFCASVFLNITQSQQATQEQKLLQGTITDLRYQVNQDKLAASGASPSPQPSPSSTPLPTPLPSPSSASSATPTPSPAAVTTKVVITSGNVHDSPSADSGIKLAYTKLPVGTTVTVGSVSGAYQQITVNGITGYILATDLK